MGEGCSVLRVTLTSCDPSMKERQDGGWVGWGCVDFTAIGI